MAENEPRLLHGYKMGVLEPGESATCTDAFIALILLRCL